MTRIHDQDTDCPETLRALTLTRAAAASDACGDSIPDLPCRGIPRMKRLLAGAAVPPRLGTFRLGTLLGVGGMGAVFQGVHVRTNARVAVKVAPRTRPRQTMALRQEVAALARVNVPGIVRVLDTGKTPDLEWMAIELVEGPSLAQVVGARFTHECDSTYVSFATGSADTRRIPVDTRNERGRPKPLAWNDVIQCMKWFAEVARALAALHDVGLVHRDVKPQNILLAPGGVPHLIDLGISHDVSDPDASRGRLEGTVPFMSPEQTQSGLTTLGPRSDVYSLAVTFHEVLTGHRTVRGSGAAALADVAFAAIAPPSRLAPEIPKTVDAIFARALKKNPEERHASAHELADEIECWLGEARRSRPATRWLHRHRGVIGAVGAITLLAAGIRIADMSVERGDVAEIRSELDAGRAEAALRLAVMRIDRLRDVAGFRDAVSLAVARAAPSRTQSMLARQAFTVNVLAGADSHDDFGRAARRLTDEFGVRDEHLVFQQAFSQHLAGKPEEALDVLTRFEELTAGSALLCELEALAATSLGRSARAASALDRLPSLMTTGAPDAGTLACLRAYRLLLGGSEVTPEELSRCRGTLVELAPKHALARSLVIRIDERIDPESALLAFEELAREDLTHPSWLATRLLLARCAMRLADRTDDPERRSDLVARAATAGVAALDSRASVLPWLVANLGNETMAWRTRSAWLAEVLRQHGGAAAFRHESATRLCALMAAHHLAAGEPDEVLRLGRLVTPHRPRCELPKGSWPSWVAFLERYLEALVYHGDRGLEESSAEVSALVARERACGHAAPSLEALDAIAITAAALELRSDGEQVGKTLDHERTRLSEAMLALSRLPDATRNQRRIGVMCGQILEVVEP